MICKNVGALWVRVRVFLGRSHKHTNNVFRLVSPVLDKNTYIFKANVFINQAQYE